MLIVTGFLILTFFLFAPCVFGSVCCGVRGEKIFLPALILNALLLYVCAAFHLARPGFSVILGCNLAMYVPVLFRLRRDGFAAFRERFLTPGMIFALIFTAVFFFGTLWRRFYTWDEISHWGAAAQLFFRDGKLGCEYGGILSHASYPPGTCLVIMLSHLCFFGVPFSENLVMYGHEMLLLGIWLYPMASLRRGQRWQTLILSLAYLGFVPVFLREDFHTCYTDAPLACLFGLCIYAVLTLNWKSRWDLFALGLLIAFLFPIRNAGFGYAVMTLILLAVTVILHRKTVFGERPFENTLWLIWIAGLTFAVKYSWVVLLNFYATPLKFGGSSITAQGIWNAFVHNVPERSWTVISAFLIRTTCGYLEVFLLIVLALLLLKRRSVNPARSEAAKGGIVFFSIAFFLFLATTLIYYIFEFHELRTLPSFDRYVSAFLLAPSFLLIFLWSDEAAEKNTASETGFGMTSIRRKRIFWILAVWAFLATLYNFVPYPMFRWRQCRLDCDRMKTDYDALLSKPGCRFTLITHTGLGFKNFYGSYLYPENFRMLETWDPVLEQKKGDSNWEYATETTPDALRTLILDGGFQYVYIDLTRPEFRRDFTSVFAPGCTLDETIDGHLCAVLPDGRLQPIPRPGESR